jgi:thioredoxin 2
MSSRVTGCPSCGTKNRVPAAASGAPRCASCKQPMPWLADATDADLTQVLGTRQLVLMDLWAPWCAPCRMVAPVLERIAERYAGQVKIVKVNVDKNPATAARYDARSTPTLVMLRDGTVVHRTVGAQPEPALTAEVDRLLAAN